jgi:hypothetical protein
MNTETTWRTLRSLVPEPGQAYSWADCCEALPRLLALETTPQDPIHHAAAQPTSPKLLFRGIFRSAA